MVHRLNRKNRLQVCQHWAETLVTVIMRHPVSHLGTWLVQFSFVIIILELWWMELSDGTASWCDFINLPFNGRPGPATFLLVWSLLFWLQGVIKKTVSDDLVENIWTESHMDKIIPSLLFNMDKGWVVTCSSEGLSICGNSLWCMKPGGQILTYSRQSCVRGVSPLTFQKPDSHFSQRWNSYALMNNGSVCVEVGWFGAWNSVCKCLRLWSPGCLP